jgi:excisionase family DNA binding protein
MSRLVTVKEIAELLSVHPNTVHGWCRDGAIPHTRIPGRLGGEYRFDVDEVRQFFTGRCDQIPTSTRCASF